MLEAEEILRKLVSYNTIKDKENTQILDYIENTLKEMGFQTKQREKFLMMSNHKETPLGFLGHTDTVEGANDWKYEKFDLTEVNGKLYGLGVCDMKSGIAAMIAAISQVDFKALKKGIKLYFTYDEEIGFSGIKEVVEKEKDFPKTMIVGEPTNNEMIVGSKGLMEYRISFQGVKAHSSTPNKGKNAIMTAVSFINELNHFYETEIKSEQDERFEIPYTTMNIGKIEGGSAINSVPDFCEFLVDFRTTNAMIESKIIEKIQGLKEKYNARVQQMNQLPSFFYKTSLSSKTCNFITEASFLKCNCIILGAGPVTAHETNEYITKESLAQLVEQYKRIIEENCR